MTTVIISLSDSLTAFVDSQVAAKGFGALPILCNRT